MSKLKLLSLLCALGLCSVSMEGQEKLSLHGEWAFRLDPGNRGLNEKWYAQRLPDKARLPGSLDEQGIGVKYTVRNAGRLTRESKYIGMAWYQKEVEIPQNWANKNISLFLERVCWETKVYVDGYYADTRNSLTTPHVYDLSGLLTPGKHVLTVLVDNTVKINIGHTFGNILWTHAITEETQTNWNGIIGAIELVVSPRIRIRTVAVYPDFKKQAVSVHICMINESGKKVKGKIGLYDDADGPVLKSQTVDLDSLEKKVILEVPFTNPQALWNEFEPSLLTWSANLEAGGEIDRQEVRFGLRDFRASGHHFMMNGKTIYLRGNVDCAIFPLTGYPPMSVDAWRRIFRIYNEYGLNHVRFHSWCPPEPAFQAADEMGMIMEVELPFWDGYGLTGSLPDRAAFLIGEATRMVDYYGNHPSFCLLSLGNELGDGKDPFLAYLVDYLKKRDPRRLFTSTTHPVDPARKDDYFIGAGIGNETIRGILPFGDYREQLKYLDRPVLTHELGQIAMFPDFRETIKYTGPLKAFYLEDMKKTLDEHHLLSQADQFRQSSGRFMVELYKENIEAQLRTQNGAGFQLLDIQDFPGQGVATVGILDAFMDSKGVVSSSQFRRFCSASVPLIRTKGFIWRNDETFTASAEIAHYGNNDLQGQLPVWVVRDHEDRVIQSGSFPKMDIPTGKTTSLGEIQFSLDPFRQAEQLTIEVSLTGTEISNSWRCWVYPAIQAEDKPGSLFISHTWNKETRKVLEQGGKVLLMPDSGSLANVEQSRWHPVFWCYQLFKQPITLGILCDPGHPALKQFPTAAYGDWQWRSILDHSEALVLDETPAGLFPIVQFIPDFNINKKLSAVFEARVGKGKLMVCTLHLQKIMKECPEARQLLHSLMEYMKSDSFDPGQSLDFDVADRILRPAE